MYDVVVVGARCAGASAAMLLARRGRKVLLIDRERFPSDKLMSTHLVWQSGVDCLKRWGLLEKLEATGCPPLREIELDMGQMALRGTAELRDCSAQAMFAPRRIVLDGLLISEAKAAGAEIVEGCRVRELLREGDRVTGAVYQDARRRRIEVPARLVIGADGLNSIVARLADAQEYNSRPKTQRMYFAYFRDLDLTAVEFSSRPGRMAFAWRTNDDEVVAGFCCRMADVGKLMGEPSQYFWKEMGTCAPDLCRRMRAGRQTTPVRSGSVRSFMRTAGGPGWALAGDAGINMDPISAAGITNALLQAEMLAELIDSGLTDGNVDAAVKRFARERDARFGPFYEFTCEMAKLQPETPEEIVQMFVGLTTSKSDTDAYFGVFAQTVPVQEFFAPDNILRIATRGRAVLEGSNL
jgi:2-polyprenyl-6-methoxyphenol hydroxylase-like FAD-dependent oxidoreductase